MDVLIKIGRDTSGIDSGEINYEYNWLKVQRLNDNDRKQLLKMLTRVKDAIEKGQKELDITKEATCTK